MLIAAVALEPMQAGVPLNSPPPFMRPSIRAVRNDIDESPVIDADLSDSASAKAAVIDDFTQLFQQSLGWLDENGNAHPLSDAVSSRIPAAPERPWRVGARPGTRAGRARRAAEVYVVFGLGRT
jgi:hypothetical protein